MTAPGTGPYWFVATPRAAGNLLANPSMEYGTAGWAGTGGATLGSSSFAQTSGAWSLRATGLSSGTGATATATLGSGTYYAASAWVRLDAVSGGSVQLHFAGTSTRTPVGSIWQRISVGTVATSTASRTLAIQGYSATGGTLYADAVVVENGSVPSTYIDGDQPGCQWTGGPHASPSTRTSQTRAGGSISRLADLGMTVDESPGIGAPPLQTISQPYAVIDGSEYQRTRVAARQFSLVSQVIGTSWANLHAKREQIIDALKIDAVGEPTPLTLLYAGAGGTAQIGAVWDGGLEFGEVDGMTEPGAVARFMSPDPYWYSQRQEGTTLAPYTVLGSVNYIAYRDPEGRWGTFGVAGTTVGGGLGPSSEVVFSIAPVNGTVFVGGAFTRAGGTAAHYIAQHVNGAWGTLVGGLLGTAIAGDSYIQTMLYNPGGTLIVGGNWGNAAAGTATRYIAQYVNGAWGTLVGGTANSVVSSIITDPLTGGFFAGGLFTGVAGTTARTVARYANNAWGTLLGGTVSGAPATAVDELAYQAGTLFLVGAFSNLGATGSAYGYAWYAGGTSGTVVGQTVGFGTSLNAIAINQAGRVYAAGGLASGTPRYLLGGGVAPLPGVGGGVYSALADRGGNVLFGGFGFSLYGRSLPLTFDLLTWNGYSWLPPDLRIVTGAGDIVYAIAQDPAGTLYVGGRFDGMGTAASVTTVVNRGAAATYPTLRLRNLSNGTARVYQLLNTTGGTTNGVWFNYVMSPGEVSVLNLTPGTRSFTSNSQGNILGLILGGSNLATWRLNPGTNTVSFFSDGASVEASLFWPLRNWSADAEQAS